MAGAWLKHCTAQIIKHAQFNFLLSPFWVSFVVCVEMTGWRDKVYSVCVSYRCGFQGCLSAESLDDLIWVYQTNHTFCSTSARTSDHPNPASRGRPSRSLLANTRPVSGSCVQADQLTSDTSAPHDGRSVCRSERPSCCVRVWATRARDKKRMSAYSHNHTSSCVRRFCRPVPDRSVVFLFVCFYIYCIQHSQLRYTSVFLKFFYTYISSASAGTGLLLFYISKTTIWYPDCPLFPPNSLQHCFFFFLIFASQCVTYSLLLGPVWRDGPGTDKARAGNTVSSSKNSHYRTVSYLHAAGWQKLPRINSSVRLHKSCCPSCSEEKSHWIKSLVNRVRSVRLCLAYAILKRSPPKLNYSG